MRWGKGREGKAKRAQGVVWLSCISSSWLPVAAGCWCRWRMTRGCWSFVPQPVIYWEKNQRRRSVWEIFNTNQQCSDTPECTHEVQVQYFWPVTLVWLFCSAAGGAWLWHHTDPSAQKQHRNAPTLQTGDSTPIFSAQATASSPDQQLQQPAYWRQPVSGAAATTQHAGEAWRGCHVLDDI